MYGNPIQFSLIPCISPVIYYRFEIQFFFVFATLEAWWKERISTSFRASIDPLLGLSTIDQPIDPSLGLSILDQPIDPSLELSTLDIPIDPSLGLSTLDQPIDHSLGLSTLDQPVDPS